MNQCVLSGNLGDDPAIFYSNEGNPIATFSLAFRSGKDKTSWIKVVCFNNNKQAEIAEKYLHKGAKIAIVGSLDQRKWETDDGQQRSSFQIICSFIEFLKTDGRGFENGEQESQNAPF